MSASMIRNGPTRDEVLSRQDELEDLRALEEGVWREIGALVQPDQGPFTSGSSNSGNRFSDVYDATQIYALDNFVGGIFGQLTNPANRWFETQTDDPDLNNWQPVKAWSYGIATRMQTTMTPAYSGFYEEAGQWFADVGTFGNACLYQEEQIGTGRYVDRCIPLKQMYWDTDATGEVDVAHRKFMLRGRQISKDWRATFDDAAIKDRSEYEIIHAVVHNPDFNPRRRGSKPWLSIYVSRDIKDLHIVKGYYDLPYHMIRWSKRAGSAYGTGPGHRARPDMAMLQEMERTHIMAGQRAADPPMLAADDSVIRVSDVIPGNILFGTVTDGGKPALIPLNTGANLQLSMEQSQQRRDAIREAFYFGLLQLLQRPQMTATEFLGFQEEKLRQMGPNLVHIQTGGLSPFIARRYGILSRAGLLPPPPPELQGRRMQVVYQSPLALAQKNATARATINFVNTALTWAQAKPDVLDNIDFDQAVAVAHDGFGPPPSVLRDPRAVAADRQARAGSDQMHNALDAGGKAVGIMAEAAHAQQATTLADQRGAA